jgi:hypothetical protein
VLVPVPLIGGPHEARLRADLDAAGITTRHEVIAVEPPDVLGLLARAGLDIQSMGRPAADDPVMFQAAAVAGVVAADRVSATHR